jgi:hypothetical protein
MIKRIVSGLFLGSFIAAPALAGNLPARTPGLWQSTTTVTGANGRPLAHEVNVVTVSCIDALNDQTFFTSEKSACASLTISGSGNSYNIDGVCQGQSLGQDQGHSVKIHETLTYAGPQALSLQAAYINPTGQMTVTSQLQWQGQCPVGMQPGDEGYMTGGVFSKTDNINDSYNQ